MQPPKRTFFSLPSNVRSLQLRGAHLEAQRPSQFCAPKLHIRKWNEFLTMTLPMINSSCDITVLRLATVLWLWWFFFFFLFKCPSPTVRVFCPLSLQAFIKLALIIRTNDINHKIVTAPDSIFRHETGKWVLIIWMLHATVTQVKHLSMHVEYN